MTEADFKKSVNQKHPPKDIPDELLALWFDANGNWNRAHELVQVPSGIASDWIHAYLHRKEGDLSNASYWYRRAGKQLRNIPFSDEWDELLRYVLNNENDF